MLKKLIVKWLKPVIVEEQTRLHLEIDRSNREAIREEVASYVCWLLSEDKLVEYHTYGCRSTIRARLQDGIVEQVNGQVTNLVKEEVKKLAHDPQHLKDVVDTVRKLQIQ